MANLILLILLSALYAVLCLFCFMELHRRALGKGKAVYLPDYMFWVGIVCGGLSLVIAWLAAGDDGEIGLTIGFGLFVLLGMFLMLGWKNCYIQYHKTGFTQKNLLGMHRSFTYDQVTAWSLNSRNPMESTVYADGKKISFNLLSANGADFLVSLKNGYRKTHGNKTLPALPELKKELGGFRAHVYNPGEYLIIFIMLFVFIAGSGVYVLIDGLQPVDANDGEQYTVAFSSWEIQDDALVLTAVQMQEPFVISGYPDYLSNFKQLIKNCDGREVFSVCARRFDPDDADPYFRVYALSSAEAVYRTFEDSTAYKKAELPFSLGIFGIFLAIFLAFSAFIYAVGSNPQKFPRWIVHCCFKEGAIEI